MFPLSCVHKTLIVPLHLLYQTTNFIHSKLLFTQDLLDGADLATPVKAPVSVPVRQEVPKEVRVLEDPPVLDSQAMGILHMEDHHQCMGTVARPDHKDPSGLARLDQDNIDLRPGQDPNAK